MRDVEISCTICGAEFKRHRNKVSRTGNNYCSSSCADVARKKRALLKNKGTTCKVGDTHKGDGYVRELTEDGWRPQHRLVMERMIGRKLLPGETVHHKNGVKDDNRPSNLELWVSHQPRGQRPEDLVEWAWEILRRYSK